MEVKKKKVYFFLFSLFLSFGCSFILTFITGWKLDKIIINYASVEIERIASVILNDIVLLDDDIFDKNFFKISRNSKGEIELINFDSKVTNQILKKINERALSRLKALEDGETKDLELSNSLKGTRLTYLDNGVVCDIPLGVLFNNSLLVNLTTSVPIRFSFVGSIRSKFVTDVKEYGFNSALIEVSIEVLIKEKITMPHSSKEIPIKTKINLATQIINGRIPTYYNESIHNTSPTFEIVV